jgi:hypothetical protein
MIEEAKSIITHCRTLDTRPFGLVPGLYDALLDAKNHRVIGLWISEETSMQESSYKSCGFNTKIYATVIILTFVVSGWTARAVDGDLDPTFGTNAKC